ncbi:vacuolar ATP synthase subunit [Niveomyces insectorum RCEF 264]|uniref:Vacuolar ATP synthase subunit n=1 Tax=Niveomyces insectorum RCEF 264 TaxID=1081102 RepID=A0A167PER2_9HYPO|nr:vacuolar ATP synthase subunit [Niveomyces insectorum RCEF 264]
MSFDQPTYLTALQNNIRTRPIPWDGAVRAGTVLEWQLAKIRAVDKVKKEARRQALERDLDGYRVLFVGSNDDNGTDAVAAGQPSVLQSAAKRTDVVQYVLVLLDDLLESSGAAGTALAKAILSGPTTTTSTTTAAAVDPYRHLLPLLAHSNQADDPIPLLAATVLASLMATARDTSAATLTRALPALLSYLASLARQTADAGLQDIGVQAASSLLYSKATRRQFWAQRSETVGPLVAILRTAVGVSSSGGEEATASLWRATGASSSNGNGNGGNGNGNGAGAGASLGIGAGGSAASRIGALMEGTIGGGVGLQLLYHVLLVLWQLSFDAEEVGDDLNDEYDIVLLYTQLLRLSPKEKTTRLLVATLYNLLSANRATLLPTAVLARLPALLHNAAARQPADPDLQEDLEQLRALLDDYTTTKTTFDEYVAEVNTGHLRWSPPHRSVVFWAENARRILDADHGAIPRKLAAIMAKPWDNDKAVLAIACNDVGALVREVPERRSALEKLGLKTRVMELMGEADENVRWESLQALGGWLKYSFETAK